jgi:hypothetical protein
VLLHSAVLVVKGSNSAGVRGFATNNKFVITRSLHTVNAVKQQGSSFLHSDMPFEGEGAKCNMGGAFPSLSRFVFGTYYLLDKVREGSCCNGGLSER